MGRHLISCRAKHPVETSGKSQPSLLILIEGSQNSDYWLFLEAPGSALLRELDDVLRETWLECCGHMSAFHIGKRFYNCDDQNSDPFFGEIDDEDGVENRHFETPLGEVLRKGVSFEYDYDFGSTTALRGKTVAAYEAKFSRKDRIRILARNEPPVSPCGRCGKPARLLDPSADDPDDLFLCVACFRKLEEEIDDIAALVNSPRAGVCAYGYREVREVLDSEAE
jgi:hypothetical protein